MVFIFDKKTMERCEREKGFDYEKSLEQAHKATGVSKKTLDWASQIDGHKVTHVGADGKIYCGKFIIREEWCISNEDSTR